MEKGDIVANTEAGAIGIFFTESTNDSRRREQLPASYFRLSGINFHGHVFCPRLKAAHF